MIVTLAGGAIVYRPTDDELSGLSIELAAFDGEVGNGTLPVEDESAVIDVATGRQARFDEGSTLLSDGFMLDQDRDRGPNPADVARQYNFGLADANALLDGFRISRHRGAETDVARVLAFAAADWPAWDTTMVLNVNTVTMPAKTYDSDGGWTSELIPDLVEFTGKTLWVHDLADGSGRCLHYHNLTSGHACGLSVSDVIADVSATVLFPWNPIRHRTSMDLRNSIKGRDNAGRTSIQSDATSIAAHDADGLQHEATVDFDATSAADLVVRTAAFLASQKDDLDTWTFLIGPLDETALALIRVGDIITVTSSVMGLTASEQRIAHMTLTPALGTSGTQVPDMWMAALEIGAPIRRRARVKNRRIVTPPPLTPVTPPIPPTGAQCTLFASSDWTPFSFYFPRESLPVPVGNTIIFTNDGGAPEGEKSVTADIVVDEPTAGELSGNVDVPGDGNYDFSVYLQRDNVSPPSPTNLILHVNIAGDGNGTVNTLVENGGGLDFIYVVAQVNGVDPDVNPDLIADLTIAANVRFRMRQGVLGTQVKAWSASTAEPAWSNANSAILGEIDHEAILMDRLTEGLFMTFRDVMWCTIGTTAVYAGFDSSFLYIATADGVGRSFTYPYGYVAGTLRAIVGGTPQPAEEDDPVAGTFLFGFTPVAGEIVRASAVPVVP